METKELKITIPENHEIDWQESAKQEKIVFKKINNKPRSWKEYGKAILRDLGYKDTCGDNLNIILRAKFTSVSIEVQDAKFLQEHTAFIKLCMLRKAWINDWKPDWIDTKQCKYCVVASDNILSTEPFYGRSHPLSFPTKEMAEDFMNTFKDLLEAAKSLI